MKKDKVNYEYEKIDNAVQLDKKILAVMGTQPSAIKSLYEYLFNGQFEKAICAMKTESFSGYDCKNMLSKLFIRLDTVVKDNETYGEGKYKPLANAGRSNGKCYYEIWKDGEGNGDTEIAVKLYLTIGNLRYESYSVLLNRVVCGKGTCYYYLDVDMPSFYCDGYLYISRNKPKTADFVFGVSGENLRVRYDLKQFLKHSRHKTAVHKIHPNFLAKVV
jgi:hypothetical protein